MLVRLIFNNCLSLVEEQVRLFLKKFGDCRTTTEQHTEMRFASFLSGGFITDIEVNPWESRHPGKQTGKTHLCAVCCTKQESRYLGDMVQPNILVTLTLTYQWCSELDIAMFSYKIEMTD